MKNIRGYYYYWVILDAFGIRTNIIKSEKQLKMHKKLGFRIMNVEELDEECLLPFRMILVKIKVIQDGKYTRKSSKNSRCCRTTVRPK